MKFCTNLCKRNAELDVMLRVVVNSSKSKAGAVLFLTDHITVLPAPILARAYNFKAHKRLLGGEEREKFEMSLLALFEEFGMSSVMRENPEYHRPQGGQRWPQMMVRADCIEPRVSPALQ